MGDPINCARMEFDNGEVRWDALVRGAQVVVICGSLGFRAELHGFVKRGFAVIGLLLVDLFGEHGLVGQVLLCEASALRL